MRQIAALLLLIVGGCTNFMPSRLLLEMNQTQQTATPAPTPVTPEQVTAGNAKALANDLEREIHYDSQETKAPARK